jgi:aryl-alcohol dehydrogenase-like predicted oxidoreductase
MQYSTFGRRSGLRVSEYALGTSNFGTSWGTGADREQSRTIFERFADAGGTFIDTADTYQQGESESFLADFLAADREHFTVASKFSFGTAGQTGVSKTGNSRKTIRYSLEQTLRRLRTDHLDLYWAHSPDFVTPIEEVVEALDDLVRAGKILAGGLSNFPAWQASAATMHGLAHGRSPIIGVQFEYSLAARDGERDLLPMADQLGLGVAMYSPLGGGLLTGKYRQSSAGRLTTMNSIIQREDTEQKRAVVDELLAIAGETETPAAEIAIAWMLARGRQASTTVVPVIGPRTLGQLDSYLRALDVQLTPDHFDRLTQVSAPELGIPHMRPASPVLERLLGVAPKQFVAPDGRTPGRR